ncbi:MAG: Ribonuclease M5 [Clostridiales bacterium 38_11]|nr:MAG: Ribonuclease M5 [Clostridiales bacterium 38_11]HBH13621.1 ribonuclease M5 [Clostridiales bacterium]
MSKYRIKEIIVVEGKDDISAVKAAVDAEVISTSGLGLNQKILSLIKSASEKQGVIVLTDPDFPGNKIRQMLNNEIKNLKHAHIPKENAKKRNNIGVENAAPEAIIEALMNAKAVSDNTSDVFTEKDLYKNGLNGTSSASKKRRILAESLGIGYCSAKQLLKRLNHYSITRDEFQKALKKLDDANER